MPITVDKPIANNTNSIAVWNIHTVHDWFKLHAGQSKHLLEEFHTVGVIYVSRQLDTYLDVRRERQSHWPPMLAGSFVRVGKLNGDVENWLTPEADVYAYLKPGNCAPRIALVFRSGSEYQELPNDGGVYSKRVQLTDMFKAADDSRAAAFYGQLRVKLLYTLLATGKVSHIEGYGNFALDLARACAGQALDAPTKILTATVNVVNARDDAAGLKAVLGSLDKTYGVLMNEFMDAVAEKIGHSHEADFQYHDKPLEKVKQALEDGITDLQKVASTLGIRLV